MGIGVKDTGNGAQRRGSGEGAALADVLNTGLPRSERMTLTVGARLAVADA
jgi:hypothetical protein